MRVRRSTPVFVVECVEPNLVFWTQRLGYRKTAEVPHGEGLGFVILEKDGQEIMFQTFASIIDDFSNDTLSGLIKEKPHIQYLEIDSLDDLLVGLAGVPLLVEPRETFYGMKEVVVQGPSGHIFCFAQRIR